MISLTQRRCMSSSSVNTEEIAKFSRVGSQWWNTQSRHGTGPLHDMNPVRVQYIRSQIAKKLLRENLYPSEHLKGLRILDVGCGGGLLSESLARLGAVVTAIDPSAVNIDVARAHSAKDPLTASIRYRSETIGKILIVFIYYNIIYYNIILLLIIFLTLLHLMNVETVAATNENFDIVTSLEVIEHVEMPLAFLTACRAVLSPGGSLFLSTMNRTAKSYALTIAAAEHVLGLVPAGTHDWRKYLSPEELTRLLHSQDVDLRVTDVSGLIATPDLWSGRIRWSLSNRDTDVNYILHAVCNNKIDTAGK